MTCVQEPSSEADRTRGGVQPSGQADPARGGVQPSGEADPTLKRGGPRPRGRSAVPPWRAAGATRVVIVSCACFRFVSKFVFCVFCEF
jgi:hypothetical protein